MTKEEMMQKVKDRIAYHADENEFEKYNEILSSVGGCIFAYSGGFGWCLPTGRSCRGFDTAKSAYIDACRKVERGTE